MGDLLKILTVFLSCIFFFGKIGMPSAIILFKFNFLKVFIVSVGSGMFGNIIFTFFSAALLKWWNKYKLKTKIGVKKKVFTKSNRRIIKIKNRFGLAGLAFITPVFPGIPIGAFLAERFFKKKFKIILYLNISVVFWSLTIYWISYFFKHSVTL